MDNKPDTKACSTRGCTGASNRGTPLAAKSAALAAALDRAKARMDKLRPQKGRGAKAAADDAMAPKPTRAARQAVVDDRETDEESSTSYRVLVVPDDAISAKVYDKAADTCGMGGGERGASSAACSFAAAPALEEGVFDLRANILEDVPLLIAEHDFVKEGCCDVINSTDARGGKRIVLPDGRCILLVRDTAGKMLVALRPSRHADGEALLLVLPNGCPHAEGDIVAQLDDGCEYSMLAPQHKYLLRRTSPRPGPPMKGATQGPPQRSIGSGLLRFQFPAASVVAGLLSTQALPVLAVQVCPPGVDALGPRKADAAADATSDAGDCATDYGDAPTCQQLGQLGLLNDIHDVLVVTRGRKVVQFDHNQTTARATKGHTAAGEQARGGLSKEAEVLFLNEALRKLRPMLRLRELGDAELLESNHVNKDAPPEILDMLRRHEDLCSNALKKRAQFMTARLLELTNPGTEKKDRTSSPKASLDEGVGDLKRRLFSGGKIRSGQRISSQLNVFNRQQLKSMHLLLDGVDDFDVDDDVAYGDVGILHMAAARRPRIHRLASAHTTNLRNQLEIADTWWTDKLPNRPASWDGHKTGFIFFEEVTTYAFLYLSEQGRAQDFIRALKALFVDLQRRRPGAHVRRIRGDMDSAYSHQGDINSPLTHELHEFLSQHPGLSIVPVAPHAHELNRAENPMGLINRNLLANYVRSWLGERAWGDLLHNAVFGYNHVSAPSSHDRQARIQTRYHRFTGRRLVASDVKGFGGEFGWRVLREGKASTGDVRAVPIYYIMADPDAGTHVLRCLRSFKVLRSRDVIMGDGSVLRSALALRPGIGRPRGMVGEPPRAAFESRLDELITDWRPDNLALTTIVVDKLSGMPTGTIRFEPHYDQDGCLTLVPNTKPLAEGGGGASDGGRDSDGTTTAGVGD
jgi:hypothetical protein